MEIITCNICFFTSINPMRASCGHVFCWPCLYRMLDSPPSIPGQAKPCPACPTTIAIPEDEVIGVSVVVPDSRTRDRADEGDITDRTRTAACQLSLDSLPSPHDAHGIIESGVDQISKEEATNSVDNQFRDVEIRRGVVSRAWVFLSKRYGSAIDEYIAIRRELVEDWMVVGRSGTADSH